MPAWPRASPAGRSTSSPTPSSPSRRPRPPTEAASDEEFTGRCSAVLSNGKRCPNAALPGSKYCGVPAHQQLALEEPDDEDNPIVQEEEPALEALADTAEPESVTEGAEAFQPGDPEDDVFPAGPGDAPLSVVLDEAAEEQRS